MIRHSAKSVADFKIWRKLSGAKPSAGSVGANQMDHSDNYAAKIFAEAKHIVETTGQSFGLDVADPESVGYFSNIILTFALSARDQGMEYARKNCG
jgi:hypothetical protein